MIPVWYDIKTHLEYVAQESEALKEALARHEAEPASRMPVRAMALSLQSIYNGFEHVMRKICDEIDQHVPRGETWHADLINRMGTDTNERPRVLSQETIKELHSMRNLRHRIVHGYSFFLEAEQIVQSSRQALELVGRFTAEVTEFFQSIDRCRTPDSGPECDPS